MADAATDTSRRKSIADEAAVSYFRQAAEEARLIAETLTDTAPGYANVLRTPKVPEKKASAIAEEYREVLKPFADVDELHDALKQMNVNKTGRTIALEHLLNLPRRYLSGFLTITDLVFAGEAPSR
jgi:hypothetical protein